MGLFSKVLVNRLAKGAAKSAAKKGASKPMTFAQKRALRMAQKESARIRSMKAKNPSDFYRGTDVRKLQTMQFRTTSKGVKFSKPKTAKLSEAKAYHKEISKKIGRNSSAMTDKQMGRALNKAYQREAWRKAPTSVKATVRTAQAAQLAAVGYGSYSITKTAMENRKRRRKKR